MAKAIILNDRVVDVCDDPVGKYHPDVVSEFVDVPDGTRVGQKADGAGGFADDPDASRPELESETPIPPKIVGYMELIRSLTSAERIATKSSTDETLVDMLDSLRDFGFPAKSTELLEVLAKLEELGILTSARETELGESLGAPPEA
tara:strand:- start:56 stop:496 length:441 start_codon:yes stop_codon:yes gene_type:complete